MLCQSCFHLIPGNDKGPVDLRSQAEGEEEEEGKATRYQQLAMGFFWGMVAPGCSRMSRADPHQDVSWKLSFASILELSPSNPALLFQSLLLASFSRHQGRLAILPPFWGTMLIMQEYFKEISKGLEPLTTYNHPQVLFSPVSEAHLNTCLVWVCMRLCCVSHIKQDPQMQMSSSVQTESSLQKVYLRASRSLSSRNNASLVRKIRVSEFYDEDVIAGLSRQIHEARSLPTYITVALLSADDGKLEGPVSPTP